MSENYSKKIVWIPIKNCTEDTMTSFKENTKISSRFFEFLIGGEVTKWFLELYPSGFRSPFYMSLFLFRTAGQKIQFTGIFNFCIIGKSGKYAEVSLRYSNDAFDRTGKGAHLFLSHARFKNMFNELVVDGTFKVCCEISISTRNSNPSSSSIFKNIQRMYDDELFTDFELRCSNGQTFKCHKAILATQSPVFHAMLSNNMKETNQGYAEVADFDSKVMKEVLRFLYGFSAENLDNIAEELVFAADKYDLDELKKKCIENITGKLTKENVVQALLISDRVSGSEKLFEECIEVVAGNFVEISKTPAWAGLSNGILTKIINTSFQTISLLKTEDID